MRRTTISDLLDKFKKIKIGKISFFSVELLCISILVYMATRFFIYDILINTIFFFICIILIPFFLFLLSVSPIKGQDSSTYNKQKLEKNIKITKIYLVILIVLTILSFILSDYIVISGTFKGDLLFLRSL